MNDNSQGSPLQGLIVSGGAGGTGCIVPFMIVLAIIIGRQLDRWLGTEPWILLGLILVSIPLSLGLMVRSALSAAREAQRRTTYPAGQGPVSKKPYYPRDTYEEDNR
jgi:hypothetical protein